MARLDKGFLVTPVDVFVESARLLDFLLSQPEISQHQVDSLWDLLYIDIMKWGTNVTDHNKLMIAGTVFQVVRATLTQYYDSYYSDIICELLNHTIERELNGCDEKEQEKFLQQLRNQSPELCDWINSYDDSEEWLSDQIADILNVKIRTTVKKKETAKKKGSQTCNIKSKVGKPKTLKYLCNVNNGTPEQREKRLNYVFQFWQAWEWIDANVTSEDFNSLFAGADRNCNFEFNKNTAILTLFLRDLLAYKNRKGVYIVEHQTNQSPTSIVKEQFGKTASFDSKRISDADKRNIDLCIYTLDTANIAPSDKRGNEIWSYDNRELLQLVACWKVSLTKQAEQEVFSGQLRVTKGI